MTSTLPSSSSGETHESIIKFCATMHVCMQLTVLPVFTNVDPTHSYSHALQHTHIKSRQKLATYESNKANT